MKLPEIDLDEIPGLPTRTGVYGSMSGGHGGKSDDTVIVVMVFIYNNTQG
jgi:hypothetical protein